MKELSIEEKARHYDEAIKRAKELLEIGVKDTRDKRVVLSFFPELKESEDEKMRKSIIYALRNGGFYDNDKTDEAIAWLEKQGEQKPVDKVEPKFKVGDWVVREYTGSIHQIEDCVENLSNHKYGYDLTDGSYIGSNEDILYHLWTIEDAKEGDVLLSLSHHLIWIYKDSEQYYACVNMNYTTENIDTNGLINIPNDVRPATKDEQTILFEMMKEAGYEWDADKKEPIKL